MPSCPPVRNKKKTKRGKRSARFQVVFLKGALLLAMSTKRGNILILATTEVVVEPHLRGT